MHTLYFKCRCTHSFWEEKKNPKKTVKTIAHDLRRKTWYPPRHATVLGLSAIANWLEMDGYIVKQDENKDCMRHN